MSFPNTPIPAWFTFARWHDSTSKRNGIHYVGDTVSITLNASGATAYSVRDYYGNVAASGSMSGTTLDLGSDWTPGWYRVYFTGPNSSAEYGNSYAITNFVVLRDDPHFLPNPTPGDLHLPPEWGGGGSDFGGDFYGTGAEMVTRAVLGLQMGRIEAGTNFTEPDFSGNNPSSPSTSSWLFKLGKAAEYCRDYWTESDYNDTARPRSMWAAFTQLMCDRLYVPASVSGWYLRVVLADQSINGANVFFRAEPGSSSGTKVTVRFPDSTTIVETYDNLASPNAASAAINSGSSYIRAWAEGGTGTGAISPTAIGNTVSTNAGICVQYMYARGCTNFEIPYNEPGLNHETAHYMKLITDVIHGAEPNAIAMGPSAVTITDIADWTVLFDEFEAIGYTPDAISIHDYSTMTNGNLGLGRYKLQRYQRKLAEYGFGGVYYQTEANNTMCSVYGVYHPRRARFNMFHTLLWEQFGLPRERNGIWYDTQHGFWSYPTWLIMTDGSLNPMGPLLRVLAEETWGQVHSETLSFGQVGDDIFLGSVYRAVDGTGTIVLMSCCTIEGAELEVAIGGTSETSFTVVDAFGNESSATLVDGAITLAPQEIPTYVRLPAGASAHIRSWCGWDDAVSLPPSITSKASAFLVGGTRAPQIADDTLQTDYGGSKGIFESSGSLPEDIVISWPENVDVDRLIVFCGQTISLRSTLIDFDVDTSTDGGSNWTTRTTVTKATPSSFLAGSSDQNAGCQRETYWDEQWVFPIDLEASYNCNALRLHVRATSYGGEPDADAVAVGGSGNGVQRIVIQDVVVPSLSLPDTLGVIPNLADFETGTSEATISTGDDGSTTAFDAVQGNPKYDSAVFANGEMAMRTQTNGDYVEWNLDNLTHHFGRLSFRCGPITGFPRIARWYDGTTLVLNLVVGQQASINGNLFITDAADTSVGSLKNLEPGIWYRIEYEVVHSPTTGQVKVKVYEHANNDLRETIITPATLNTGTKATKVRFGSLASDVTYWFDDLGAASDAFLGPGSSSTSEMVLVGAVPI